MVLELTYAIAVLIVGIILYAVSFIRELPAPVTVALKWIGIVLIIVGIILLALSLLGVVALFITPHTLGL